MITDELFRNIDFVRRRRYVQLVDSVKESGGEVRLFSSMHASGERLGQLTGIAAILRFPMPDLDLVDEQHPQTTDEQLDDDRQRTVDPFDNEDENRDEASAW